MYEPDSAHKIGYLQRQADQSLYRAALGINLIGGDVAVEESLHHTLAHLAGVAIGMLGQQRAIELMVHGFQVAEGYTEGPGW